MARHDHGLGNLPTAQAARRGQSQSMATLDALFRPRSIAVIGTSRRPGTIGWQILDNLLRHGFGGVVYPVNPKAHAIHSIRAWPSVGAIPDEIDLAIVVVPAAQVLGVVEECGKKGVRGIVLISAGFREIGGEGIALEAKLMARIKHYGIRLVGPNCMGILNTAEGVSMNATFAPNMPPAGPISFMSQSGALGVTILDYASEYGIGIRQFASVGNKPDISGTDLLEYWENDPETGVILMYLEDFGDPRCFIRAAQRVSRTKPIAVVKSGRSGAGARAASSHTGALAGTDRATDALLAQCGVLRAQSIEELFDIAMAFENQPIPKGNRVAIVTNAGGPGIIVADALEGAGLTVPSLSPETEAALRQVLPSEASVRNPVDMIASATAEIYQKVLSIVLADEGIDAAVAAFVPPLGIRQTDVAQSIVAARREHPYKPLLAVLMGKDGLPEGKARLNEAGVPAYIFPESAARALSALDRQRIWLAREVAETEVFEVDGERVSAILDQAEAEGRIDLTELEALEVFKAYGIPTIRSIRADDEAATVSAAQSLGYPVVLKILSPDIAHKTEVGGVQINIGDEKQLRGAYREMLAAVTVARPEARIDGVLVAPFLEGGVETVLGMSLDGVFGPLVMFGIGGIHVEAMGDVAFRVQPVTRPDAQEMIESLRGKAILRGNRGAEPVDEDVLIETILRVSQLAGDHDRIAELDINPFLALSSGACALDARIRILRR